MRLTAFVAKTLSVPKRAVTIASGHQSRDKRVRVEGVDDRALRRAFGLPPDG